MRRIHMAGVVGLAIAVGIFIVSGCQSHLSEKGPASTTMPAEVRPVTLYDRDPNHLWNRLYSILFIRTSSNGQSFGQDRLDPLLWHNTTHLVEGPSHTRALAVLDEFLNKHGERLIQDPLKRAILQRDLWAVFDWAATAEPGRDDGFSGNYAKADEKPLRELQTRLALAIDRLALPAEQLAKLPDNYAAAVHSSAYATAYDAAHPETPFLPPDIFAPDGPWVCLGINGNEVVAPDHVKAFNGHSTFLIFLRLPEGRQATINYLATLRSFPNPEIVAYPRQQPPAVQMAVLNMNQNLPQFSAGTEVALVRQALLMDDHGNLVSTGLTESVQIRVYNSIQPNISRVDKSQSVYEFKLNRMMLFAGVAGGLHALDRSEKDFVLVQFRGDGFDPFEGPIKHPELGSPSPDRGELHTCFNCHNSAGIYSINSFNRISGINLRISGTNLRPPALEDLSVDREREATTDWKKQQYNWGLLQGMLAK